MIPEPVRDLLDVMTAMTTTMPTLAAIVAACEAAEIGQDDVLDRLGAAMELGLIDAADDFGSETLFTLSPHAAGLLGVEPTFDSRRWQSRESRRLIGPHDPDGRYRDRRPSTSEDLSVPLHRRVDPRQMEPHEVLALAEEVKPFDGDDNPPMIVRFYGLGVIWRGEEVVEGTCPYCKSAVIGVHAYCLKCHNAGMDRFMKKPVQSRRKQMPRGKSKLKGGV